MKLTTLRVSNFQCFGEGPTTITFEPTTFLIGPNGSGKTAILQGLSRMFALDPNLRRVRSSDFHVDGDDGSIAEKLWLEADFEFPELKDSSKKHPTIPSHFAHMRLVAKDAVPRVRYRLEASLDEEGEIEETFDYVVEVDADDKPVKRAQV